MCGQEPNTWLIMFASAISSHINSFSFNIIPFTEEKEKEEKRKRILHWPRLELGSPAWQASILPLDHQCFLHSFVHFSFFSFLFEFEFILNLNIIIIIIIIIIVIVIIILIHYYWFNLLILLKLSF